MSREGISLLVIQRQLGHTDLAITSRDALTWSGSGATAAASIEVQSCR